MEFSEALSEFDDESIDLLHVARTSEAIDGSHLDLTAWTPKLRNGGIILVTNVASDERDDGPRRVWRELSESCPSASVSLPGLVGVVQVPVDGKSPLVDLLQAEQRGASALFRSLGERMEYRHALSSEALSSGGIRRYLSDVMEENAGDIRRLEAQHGATLEAKDRELASVSERLLTRAYELKDAQSEADCLLAKLATQAARHEQELASQQQALAQLQDAHASELQQLLASHVAEVAVLRGEIANRDAHIEAVSGTLSWRVTRPLRMVQSTRLKLLRRTTSR
jgi:hypothetical protein